jgi:hypothetical protein
VFILEHYFAYESSAVVREAFNNAYPDNKIPNNTTIHRLVTIFRWMFVFEKAVDIFCTFFLANNNKTQLVCLVTLTSPKLPNTVVDRVAF